MSVHCDNCRRDAGPVRIACIDCPGLNIDTVDPCCTVACTGEEVRVSRGKDLFIHHLPSHSLLRMPYKVHFAMEASVFERARQAVKRAEKLVDVSCNMKQTGDSKVGLRKVPASEEKEDVTKLCCVICRKVAEVPLWICVECEGQSLRSLSTFWRSKQEVPTLDATFLCNKCGIEEIHHETHLCVRYWRRSENVARTLIEQRLIENEERVKQLREEMNKSLQSIREEMLNRLDRIERLLGNTQGAGTK